LYKKKKRGQGFETRNTGGKALVRGKSAVYRPVHKGGTGWFKKVKEGAYHGVEGLQVL